MSLLIAVKSCRAHLARGDHHAIRSTWGKTAKAAGIDVRFFIGTSDQRSTETIRHEPDELSLSCPDDYMSLPAKTREICMWFSGKTFTHIMLVDNDTYVYIGELPKYPIQNYHYSGFFNARKQPGETFEYNAVDPQGNSEYHEKCWAYCSGGLGYFLSKDAATEVAYSRPTSWAEDLWVAQVIGPKIAAGEMNGLHLPKHSISEHWGNHGYNVELKKYDPANGWMQRLHAEGHKEIT